MCDLPHNSRLPFTSKRPLSVIDIGQTFAATRTIRLESPLKLIRVGTRNGIYNETGHPSAAQTQRRFNVDNTVAKNVSSIIPACHVSECMERLGAQQSVVYWCDVCTARSPLSVPLHLLGLWF